MMDEREIRLRCIEAAAKNPQPHKDGYSAAVLGAASVWFDWIISKPKEGPLGLPKAGLFGQSKK